MTEQNHESYWAEINNNYEPDSFEPIEGDIKRQITIDAWRTDDDSEQGNVIAYVIMTKQEDVCVIFIDNLARYDKFALEKINEVVQRLEADKTS